MLSDLQHLQRYASTGDAHAFRELVQAHGAMVHATALRVTRDAPAAQDVAQETFLELARKAGGITQSVAAWLHRVAWNRACDAVRRENTRKRVEDAMAETWHTDREATWPEIEPHVDEALNELPQELREVLVLYFLEGRTQADIARHLDRNQATVSRAIERGVEAMRVSLKKRGMMCGAGLGSLLSSNTVQAMPPAVASSLKKVTISKVLASPFGLPSLWLGAAALAVLSIAAMMIWSGAKRPWASEPATLITQVKLTKTVGIPQASTSMPVRPVSRMQQEARETTVSLRLERSSLGEALAYLQGLTGFEVILDKHLHETLLQEFDATNISLEDALQKLADRFHLDVLYEDRAVRLEAVD